MMQATLALAAIVLSTLAQAQPAPANAAPPLCAACHGAHGEGGTNGAPRLAGQNADYMSHALSMFKAGTRASAVMQPIAAHLTEGQMLQLAEYFSKQNPPLASMPGPPAAELVLAGRRLAQAGAAGTPACFSCHGVDGAGNGARFPRIAGQPARFLVDRLHEFQARAGETPPRAGTMTAVAATLDDHQIEAAAAYLSVLQL